MVAWHKYHTDKTLNYDYILGSGDFGNINHEVLPEDLQAESANEVVQKRYDTMSPEQKRLEEEAEKDITKILLALEDNIPGRPPIYYIPGNHDPKAMMLGPLIRPTLTLNSVNLHGQWVELREGLSLAALGGSCASYLQAFDAPRS